MDAARRAENVSRFAQIADVEEYLLADNGFRLTDRRAPDGQALYADPSGRYLVARATALFMIAEATHEAQGLGGAGAEQAGAQDQEHRQQQGDSAHGANIRPVDEARESRAGDFS